MEWNPQQYDKFRAAREQPFADVVGLIRPVERPRIVDLGCGPGNLTRRLRDHFPAADIVGIDSSPAMLQKARELAAAGLAFVQLDIAEYAQLLYAAGVADPNVFEKIYPHVLPDADAVLEWARGTALLPYLERLPPAQHGPYLEEVRRRLHARYPERPVFFPFRRIIFHARRA